MGILEGFVLLVCGLFAGVLATVYDVFAVGGASFLSHFALWVVLNALVAVHVESRLRAILWAIPFNLGYIEGYFISTVMTFEYYTKSTMVPLAAVALISPLLAYALWTARKEKNAYGRLLAVAIAVGTSVASYMINGELDVYTVVMSVILLLILTVLPVRQLKVTRSERAPEPQSVVGEESVAAVDTATHDSQEKNEPSPRRISVVETERVPSDEDSFRRQRKLRARQRREQQKRLREEQRREELEREKRRHKSVEQRRFRQERRNDDDAQAPSAPSIPSTHGMSTLGTVRPARRSTRG
jgi:hypothetical protein